MIRLKRCNYFTGDMNVVSNVVNSIVEFLEIDGINPLLFTPPKPIGKKGPGITNLIYSMNPQIIWTDYDDFASKIEDQSNIFRVNLLVFDFWGLSRLLIPKYQELIDKLDIDYIIVAKEYIYKSTDDVADFHVRGEYRDDMKFSVWVTNKIDGWSAELDSLKTGYIRDRKIDDIFNADE
jgi:hypothetical protein